MSNGLTRLQTRFLGDPTGWRKCSKAGAVRSAGGARPGLVSFAPDELDWDDEVRLAVEGRAALSPDALTGMEANLRFAGPETMETKIFGRLTAWQNWIFIRPNAVGEKAPSPRTGRRRGPSSTTTVPSRPDLQVGRCSIHNRSPIDDLRRKNSE